MSKLSTHAQRALERLTNSWMLNWSFQTDAQRNDDRCTGADNPNEKYNAIREYYLGSLQVGHAADTLNSYCQSILAEIIVLDEGVWISLAPRLDKKRNVSRAEAIERLKRHKGPDGMIRDFLRDEVQCFWGGECDIVAKLRNKYVHQNGHDPEREVEKLIALNAGKWSVFTVEVPVGVIPVHYLDDEWLDADISLGKWACVHVRDQIHAMDQNLCHRFALPRDRWRPRPISRQLGSLPAPRPNVEQGAPVPVKHPSNATAVILNPVTNSLRHLDVSQEEILCARAWRSLSIDIQNFVLEYVKEARVRIVDRHAGLAGNVLGHTIRGYEHSLEFSLLPGDVLDVRSSKLICVRLRQKDFKPLVTVWGTDSQMQDFSISELNDEVKEYLRDVIDRVITR